MAPGGHVIGVIGGATDAPLPSPPRYAAGHVPGARNVPFDRLSESVRSGELDAWRARPVAVVCASGARSAQATVRLSKVFGFEDVTNVAGGTMKWTLKNLPLEK